MSEILCSVCARWHGRDVSCNEAVTVADIIDTFVDEAALELFVKKLRRNFTSNEIRAKDIMTELAIELRPKLHGIMQKNHSHAQRPEPARAVNLRVSPFDIYVGRPGHGFKGPFGNPYAKGVVVDGLEVASREQSIALYKTYFEKRVAEDEEFRARALMCRGKRLGCFCKPNPCHGDVVADWVNQYAP